MSTSPSESLETRLHEWAIKEMGMLPMGRHINANIPSVENLQYVCQGKAASDIWLYVLKHVRSTRNAHKIKGNIVLAQESGVSEATENSKSKTLQDRSTQLKIEISKVKDKCETVEKSVEYLKHKILKAEEQVTVDKCKISELQQSTMILKSHNNNTLRKMSELQQLKTTLESKLSILEQNDNFSYGTNLSKCGELPLLKTLLEICETVSDLLRKATYSTINEDKKDIFIIKKKLQEQLQEVLNNHKALIFISAMKVLTEQDIANLTKLVNDVDLLKDAEELRLQCSKGDKSNTLKTIEQSIQHLKELHVKLSFDALKYNSLATKTVRNLEDVAEQSDKSLNMVFPDLEDKELVKAVQLEHCTLVSQEQYLRTLKASLREINSELVKCIDAPLIEGEKQQRMKDLDYAIKKNQDLITTFVHRNNEMSTEILSRHKQLKTFVQESMFPNLTEMEKKCVKMQNWIWDEIDLYKTLKFSSLCTIAIESSQKIPVENLLLNRFTHCLVDSACSVMKDLKFRSYLGPEELVLAAFYLNLAIQGHKKSLKRQLSSIDFVESRQRIILADIKTPIEHIVDARNKLSEDFIKLKDFKQLLHSRVPDLILKLKKALKNWQTEPAQYVNLDVKVEGRLYTDWLQILLSCVRKSAISD